MESFGDQEKRSSADALLTWKDLRVTVPKKDGCTGIVTILDGLSGYAEAGEVLGVMGPSGSGKTTLLNTLAGRLDWNMKHSGQILINGRNQGLAFGTSAYITQDDTLMTTLTVREAVHYSALLQLPETMSKTEKLDRADMVIKKMGLHDSMDKRIGGPTIRGISNGQKRRVSICLEILTRPKILFLDEPTRGLDSAASYHVMSYIINLVRYEGITAIASVHQPSAEVFDLFHKLCLVSYGKLVYFGPANDANRFFSENGFPCPAWRNPSDHYLGVINNDFELEHTTKMSTHEAINVLVKSYQSSETSQQVQTRICTICEHEGAKLEKGSQASFINQCLILTKRSFVNMYRDPGYYRLRFAIYMGVCIFLGFVFFNLGQSYKSIKGRTSMLGFVSAYLTFMTIGGFPSFVEEMKIFGRERLNGYYGVGAFVISNTLSSLPYVFIVALLPGAVAYYLAGLRREPDHFLCFTLILFAGIAVVESIMMIIASVVPDFLMGIITGAGIQCITMLSCGFFRLPNELPKLLWKYPMYYISFDTYGAQAFYKNEFEGLVFYDDHQRKITGHEILRDTLQVQLSYSKWVDLAILIGMVIFNRLIFFGLIKIAELRRNLHRTS